MRKLDFLFRILTFFELNDFEFAFALLKVGFKGVRDFSVLRTNYNSVSLPKPHIVQSLLDCVH